MGRKELVQPSSTPPHKPYAQNSTQSLPHPNITPTAQASLRCQSQYRGRGEPIPNAWRGGDWARGMGWGEGGASQASVPLSTRQTTCTDAANGGRTNEYHAKLVLPSHTHTHTERGGGVSRKWDTMLKTPIPGIFPKGVRFWGGLRVFCAAMGTPPIYAFDGRFLNWQSRVVILSSFEGVP